MHKRSSLLCCILLLAGLHSSTANPSEPKPGDAPEKSAAQTPPVIDGGLGPCSLELTVATADGKPAGAAQVKVHIAYGFGGFHKLDLEAGTNSEGKVRFTGMPSRLRRPPLEFHASKDGLEGFATYDPATECQAKHAITLQRPKATEQ